MDKADNTFPLSALFSIFFFLIYFCLIYKVARKPYSLTEVDFYIKTRRIKILKSLKLL